jgi:hypothetical protein
LGGGGGLTAACAAAAAGGADDCREEADQDGRRVWGGVVEGEGVARREPELAHRRQYEMVCAELGGGAGSMLLGS